MQASKIFVSVRVLPLVSSRGINLLRVADIWGPVLVVWSDDHLWSRLVSESMIDCRHILRSAFLYVLVSLLRLLFLDELSVDHSMWQTIVRRLKMRGVVKVVSVVVYPSHRFVL